MSWIAAVLRRIEVLLSVLLLLLALVAGAWFASENPERVAPIVFGYPTIPLSLGLYICVAALAGLVLGALISYLSTQRRIFQLKRANASKSRQLKKLQAELQSQPIPVKKPDPARLLEDASNG